MSGQTTNTWVDKVERAFAFYPPRPEKGIAFLALSLLSLFLIFGNIFRLAYWSNADSIWVEAAATTLFLPMIFVMFTAEALLSGVLGQSVTRFGRALRAISYFFIWPMLVLQLAATGYSFWGSSGALIGLAFASVFCVCGLLVDLRRGRQKRTRTGMNRAHE